MRIVVLALIAACNSSSSSAPAPKGKSAAPEGEMPVGVWVGLGEKMNLTSPLLTDLKLQVIVAWPDGRFSYDAPWSGLADLDYAAWARDVKTNPSLGGRPGTWTASGENWKIAYTDGGTADLERVGDQLKIGRAKLKRVKDVTGAKLDGAYTWWGQPEDPLLGGAGCQPVTVFTPAGTFDDRGGFVLSCPAAAGDPNAPGTGTYELRDFSLIMKYADGRTAKHQILPPITLDLHADNANAIIMGRVWARRTGPLGAAPTPPQKIVPTPPVATVDTTTFGGAIFATPPGKKQEADAALAFTTDSCLVALNGGVTSSGDLAGDFTAAWKTLVEGDVPAAQQAKTPSGLAFAAGGAQTAAGYRAMFVFAVGRQQLRVIFATATEAALAGCGAETMLSSIRAL